MASGCGRWVWPVGVVGSSAITSRGISLPAEVPGEELGGPGGLWGDVGRVTWAKVNPGKGLGEFRGVSGELGVTSRLPVGHVCPEGVWGVQGGLRAYL